MEYSVRQPFCVGSQMRIDQHIGSDITGSHSPNTNDVFIHDHSQNLH